MAFVSKLMCMYEIIPEEVATMVIEIGDTGIGLVLTLFQDLLLVTAEGKRDTQ